MDQQPNRKDLPGAHAQPQEAPEQGLDATVENAPIPARMEPLLVEVPPHVVPVAAVNPARRGRTTRMRHLEIMAHLLMQNEMHVAPRRCMLHAAANNVAVPRPAGLAGTVLSPPPPRLRDEQIRNYRLWNNLPERPEPIPVVVARPEEGVCPQLDNILKRFIWLQLICGFIWSLVNGWIW